MNQGDPTLTKTEQRAQNALVRGDWQAAAQLLRKAATMAEARHDPRRAVHCEQMAAALFRAAGSLDEALAAAQRIAQRDPTSPQARFAAQAETAEALMAAGDHAKAAAAWRVALLEAETLRLPAWACATVMRRLAAALAYSHAQDDAWAMLDAAAELQRGTQQEADAAWIDVEQAQLAQSVGNIERARLAVHRPRVQLAAATDPALRAECWRTVAECALAEGDYNLARIEAQRARDAALTAIAPVTYFGATVALARAAETQGDRATCYRTLATAWVTLADLLGEPVAQTWVEPVLQAYRLAWGPAAFDAVRAEHDRVRRAARRGA
ncbi:hypothetical protein [Methylotetracoccus oryzae]|uniref:hypothetical protein n=1 Tax=Methylotetracoccus oryzae TaxID=1919059 RepID=UPI001119B5A1|nr:hypothetical protein [Methylotetracoccus oryzae]